MANSERGWFASSSFKPIQFIVPAAPGAGAITVKELGRYLEEAGMAKFKWPERVEIVKEFPMTNSGKLSKLMLRDLIAGKLKTEAAKP